MSREAVLGSMSEGEPAGGGELGRSAVGSQGEMEEGGRGKPGPGRED